MFRKIALVCLLLPSLAFAEQLQPLDKVVAIVNDDVITESELSSQLVMLRQQLQAKNLAIPKETLLRKQVLQHLIDVNLQLQMAKRNNISIDDVEINEAISKIAESNKITLTQLREALSQQGMNWNAYRANIKKEMLISRLQQQAVSKDVVVSPKQVEEYLRSPEYNQQKNASYHVYNIVIPLSEHPSPDELNKAKAKANTLLLKIKKGANFSELALAESTGEFALDGGDLGMRHLAELPELFAKKVVTMKKGEVAGPIRAANGFQLIKLVDVAEEQVHHSITKAHVRHILVKQDSSMTTDDAQKQIQNIYQQLKSGKDFASMAKRYSVDAASAVNGGDLGWVDSSDVVPEFAKSMETLPLHQLSKPVKSPFGWHLIEVLERKKVDDSQAFQRQQVRQFLSQRKFAEAAQNWVQHIRSDAYIKVMDKDLA